MAVRAETEQEQKEDERMEKLIRGRERRVRGMPPATTLSTDYSSQAWTSRRRKRC